eukprot:3598997-Amphidinium_carterae.1
METATFSSEVRVAGPAFEYLFGALSVHHYRPTCPKPLESSPFGHFICQNCVGYFCGVICIGTLLANKVEFVDGMFTENLSLRMVQLAMWIKTSRRMLHDFTRTKDHYPHPHHCPSAR